MREREAKLSVDNEFELPDLDELLRKVDAQVLAPKQVMITDVYYDTADLRLLSWGCTLRHRKRKGWTVKLPVETGDEALSRDEINLGGRAGSPPAEALQLVTSFSRGQPLASVATVTTERTIRSVCSTDGRALAEVADDVVSSETSSGMETTFRQVEVELAAEADPAVLAPIVQRLTDAGAQLDRGGIKLAIVLGRPQLHPDVVIPDLPKRPSARDIVHRAIARSVEQLIIELPRARLGLDPEGIHQARVATRRLRSDLRTFKPLLDPTWAAGLHPRVCDLAEHLGQVRDADVLHQLLQNTLATRPEIDDDAGNEVLALLSRQRTQAMDALHAQLDRPETHLLLDDLVTAAADPPTTAAADEPAKRQLPDLVNKRWRRLRRASRRLGRHPPPRALHDARILAKRTRYATEAIAPAFGPKTRRFAKALANLQDTLGDLNDASIANQWLNDNAAEFTPPAAFAAGRLAQTLHDAATDQEQWRSKWATVEERKPSWIDRKPTAPTKTLTSR